MLEEHNCKKYYYKRRYFSKKLYCSVCKKHVADLPLDFEDYVMDLKMLLGLVQQAPPYIN